MLKRLDCLRSKFVQKGDQFVWGAEKLIHHIKEILFFDVRKFGGKERGKFPGDRIGQPLGQFTRIDFGPLRFAEESMPYQLVVQLNGMQKIIIPGSQVRTHLAAG